MPLFPADRSLVVETRTSSDERLGVNPKAFYAGSLAMPVPIEAGMRFALETFSGDGDDGAGIESRVVVTENGHEVVTKWPCDELMVCDPR
jgi:Xaa-Pro aminopeptidase